MSKGRKEMVLLNHMCVHHHRMTTAPPWPVMCAQITQCMCAVSMTDSPSSMLGAPPHVWPRGAQGMFVELGSHHSLETPPAYWHTSTLLGSPSQGSSLTSCFHLNELLLHVTYKKCGLTKSYQAAFLLVSSI